MPSSEHPRSSAAVLIPADLNDESDSSFSWYRGERGKLHCASCRVSPVFDMVECIGYEATMMAVGSNDDVWQARVETALRAVERMVESTSAELCLMCDDIGSAHGAMIGEGVFRASYLPLLTRFVDVCKGHGKISAWHSCGRLEQLIPALRDSMVDVLRLDQLGLMDVRAVRGQLHGWQILWFAPDKRGWPDIAAMTETYYEHVVAAMPAWLLCNPKEECISGQTPETIRVIRDVRSRLCRQK
jgi:hypothetical protein